VNKKEKSDMLKRFNDALAGRTLSGTAAFQINDALSKGGPYRHLCEQGEKLQGIYKLRLQQIVDQMVADGVIASKSLLTAHQRRSLHRRTA